MTRTSQAAAVVGAAALGAALLVSGCGGQRNAGGRGQAADPGTTMVLGSLPAFLPRASIQPDRVLTASATRPALTTEGDTVRVDQPGGSVLVTVTGPEVPGEGLPYQTTATTCTWSVTFTAATAPVPIDLAGFSTLDHLGTVDRPTLVPGQPVPPSSVSPGQTVSFELRAVMRTGEGVMRWAPRSGVVLASWDFEVETD